MSEACTHRTRATTAATGVIRSSSTSHRQDEHVDQRERSPARELARNRTTPTGRSISTKASTACQASTSEAGTTRRARTTGKSVTGHAKEGQAILARCNRQQRQHREVAVEHRVTGRSRRRERATQDPLERPAAIRPIRPRAIRRRHAPHRSRSAAGRAASAAYGRPQRLEPIGRATLLPRR